MTCLVGNCILQHKLLEKSLVSSCCRIIRVLKTTFPPGAVEETNSHTPDAIPLVYQQDELFTKRSTNS